MDLARPFRGSAAVGAGVTTWRRLDGPQFDRIDHDTYVLAGTALDLVGRARAAALAVPGAVVGGHAAAEILGAPCAPRNATVDLVVGRRRVRPREGVHIRQHVLTDTETWVVDDVTVTSPLRTMVDLARMLEHDDAVVAVDALAHRYRLDVTAMLSYPATRTNVRGGRRLAEVVADADPRAESPPETRLRLLLRRAGLAAVPQREVFDARGRFVGRLDFAWEELRLGGEYQGDHHRTDRTQWLRDAARTADLAACGWLVLPITADDVFRWPATFVRRVRAAQSARRRELGVVSSAS